MSQKILTLEPKKATASFLKGQEFRRRCPLVRYRACWCRGMCAPRDGMGQCGQIAPHATLGKTQQAILDYKRRHG